MPISDSHDCGRPQTPEQARIEYEQAKANLAAERDRIRDLILSDSALPPMWQPEYYRLESVERQAFRHWVKISCSKQNKPIDKNL